jgi:hypothetical protein
VFIEEKDFAEILNGDEAFGDVLLGEQDRV